MNPLYIIDLIGYFGPIILFVSSILLLYKYKKTNYLFGYIIGIMLSCVSNLVLKEIIKQPRPKGNFVENNHKRIFSSDIYGMPSGHAQHVFFSTFFIYLTLQNHYIALVYLVISVLTMVQRVKYQNHTILQVIVGGIIGMILAYMAYIYTSKKIVGKLLPKKEDDAIDIA
jgi:membrane-associated phospholipid phosphatase